MEYLGLAAEVFFLGIGVYFYLLAIGKIKAKDPAAQKKLDDFLASNSRWLRMLALALSAIMVVNIYLHLSAIFAG